MIFEATEVTATYTVQAKHLGTRKAGVPVNIPKIEITTIIYNTKIQTKLLSRSIIVQHIFLNPRPVLILYLRSFK